MRWGRHVARIVESRGVYRALVGKPEGKRPLGRPGVDGRIILRWIFRKWDVSDSVGSDKDNRGVSCLNSGRGTSSLKRGWYSWETMKWIHLALDRDKWQSVLKTVMNIPVT
jgi:hypothetical protein